MEIKERFLNYVSFDTQSVENSQTVPSTSKQLKLGKYLVEELQSLGIENAKIDEYGVVYGTIPSNNNHQGDVIGFIAHMDTSPDASGKDIHPQIIKNYQGQKITLNEDKKLYLDPEQYPQLLHLIHHDLITTDGTTLLGADDKAGIAIIMQMVEYLYTHPEFKHNDIQITFTPDEEIGCGNGKLWENNTYNLRNREIFLSDISEGMLEDTRKKLGNDYNYIVLDAQNIPFKNHFFDTVIANHVLFYLQDLNLGLLEISRVLKDYGIFYCTTYGKNHMKEITEIVHNFDSRIQLSNNNLVEHFGLENGKTLLSPYFKQIELKRYDDYLIVDDAKALMNYIMSCHGNQKEYLGYRLKEFQAYLEKIIDENNGIKITKDCGLFICRK